jgi:hypothetical protein
MQNKKLTKFRKAVKACAGIGQGYCAGLQALGANASHIEPEDTRLCCGSVDIDKCLLASDPQGARWDYAVGYDDKAYFVEVHPAHTGNVSEMVKKVDWLKAWLNADGAALKGIKEGEYYWIPSGSCKILEGSPKKRMLAQRGIKIVKPLVLPEKTK